MTSQEEINFEAFEDMLKAEKEESSLLKMGDFLAQPGGCGGVDEGSRYLGAESEKEEKEDVWKLFCLIEDLRRGEKDLRGDIKKKLLKEEEVKEMREDREKFCVLKKKLEEEDFKKLREGRFLRKVSESFPFKVRVSARRVLWEKKKMVEMLLVKYIDEKRAEYLKSECVKVKNFFRKCEELEKEIEEKRESFEVKKSKEERRMEEEEKKNEGEEKVDEKSESVDVEIEDEVIREEGENEIEEVSGIGEESMEKGEEKDEERSQKKSEKWREVLDEEGKDEERKSKKTGKVKKGDWVRREYFVRLQDSEMKQRWKCKVCERVLEKKKVNLLEVHRHFLESHGELGKEIEIEKLPGDYDCRKLWKGFYERSKIEMSEELERFLKQERKRKERKDGEDERDMKKRKLEEGKEEEKNENISVPTLAPSSHTLYASFVKGKKLKVIQEKVQKVLKKVIIIFFSFLFSFNFFNLGKKCFYLWGNFCHHEEIAQTFCATTRGFGYSGRLQKPR